MIDLQSERVLTLSEATHTLPILGGKRLHPASLWRWIRRGIRDIHLEHLRIGGRIVTSAEALNRFAVALAAADAIDDGFPVSIRKGPARTEARPPRARTTAQRERDVHRAEGELEKAGVTIARGRPERPGRKAVGR